ncbi:MAG: GTPase Era [Calditrichaceae bacterium]|nr:GTPase Era [Calditrichaceae bacterium]MBN2707778.1 GTPase Era [Calditrichaceae bacterium]RQV96412.1 MAG: GTPase Era [Calditrichota bacterium]
MTEIPKDFKSGYAAIIGLPNAGKSTLMNALLDIRLSITSPKPQTTRRRVLGILDKPSYQIVFLDTPGILEPKYLLQNRMMGQVHQSVKDADSLVFIIDALAKTHPVGVDLKKVNPAGKPMILAINKIDRIPKPDILLIIDQYRKYYPFQAMVPISALKKDGLDALEHELVRTLPLGLPYYPPGSVTDHPERFFAAEIIREKIFGQFFDEVPYSTEVTIEQFIERPGKKDYISASIYVERTSQKGILIGKKGEALKQIGQQARQDIEALLDRPVYLDLKVKVSEKWRRDEIKLKRLGY